MDAYWFRWALGIPEMKRDQSTKFTIMNPTPEDVQEMLDGDFKITAIVYNRFRFNSLKTSAKSGDIDELHFISIEPDEE